MGSLKICEEYSLLEYAADETIKSLIFAQVIF